MKLGEVPSAYINPEKWCAAEFTKETRANPRSPTRLKHRRMASPNLSLCLPLLLWAIVAPSCCQHWSYGLNPGGKRDVDGLADDVKLFEVFQHVDTPCSVLGCAEESPVANIYRSKRFRGSVTNRESGHITY
ncbi:uncharacterized protein ACO6RY_05312 [Pungitius sinensis]